MSNWRITEEEYKEFRRLRKKLWMEDLEGVLECRLEDAQECESYEEVEVINELLKEENLEEMASYFEDKRLKYDSDVPDSDIMDEVVDEYINNKQEEK